MNDIETAAARIAELETELRQRDDKIKELTSDRDEALELVGRMREQIEDTARVTDQWIEVFDMQQGENGKWLFDPDQTELWQQHAALWERHRALLREWNKTVAQFNAVVAPRAIGRPLAASEAQQAEVLKQRKAGASLRTITAATGLSLRTVRTIVEKAASKGRAGKRTVSFGARSSTGCARRVPGQTGGAGSPARADHRGAGERRSAGKGCERARQPVTMNRRAAKADKSGSIRIGALSPLARPLRQPARPGERRAPAASGISTAAAAT